MFLSNLDLGLLSDDLTQAELLAKAKLAIRANIASVCIKPHWLKMARDALANSQVQLCTVINFPEPHLSYTQILESISDVSFADEFDIVMPRLKLNGETKSSSLLTRESERKQVDDLLSFLKECRVTFPNKVLKLIIESSLLTTTEMTTACQCAREAKFDFIKTSTGVLGQARLEDVKMIVPLLGKTGLKISGGLKSIEDLLPYLEYLNSVNFPLDKNKFRIGSSAWLNWALSQGTYNDK